MADRSSSNRDIVFCHQCDNEWYRDEHGLECPDCYSDFTEIVEPEHDPRQDDRHIPADDPPQHPLHDHNPWEDEPDPDEEDIGRLGLPEGFRWEPNGSGGYTGRGTITHTYTSGGEPQQQGGNAGGVMGMLGPMLQGIIGGAQQPQLPQGAQQGGAAGQRRTSSTPGSPRNSQNAYGINQGNQVRHINGPHYSVTFASNIRGGSTINGMPGGLFPRDANGPQPMQHQPDGIEQVMQQMFANIGAFSPPGYAHNHGPVPGGAFASSPFAAGPGQPGFPAGLFGLFGPPGGVHGDAVYSQEALDRIITQLMEQHHAGNAPGPASEAAINSLPQKSVSESDLDPKTQKAECSICMEEVEIGEKVALLPCSHWFHGECVSAWLHEHDTCPQCRRGIMPKDSQNAGRPRNTQEAPAHDMANPRYAMSPQMPDVFPGHAPPQQSMRRHSSSSEPSGSRQGSSSGGLLNRMRDAFGGGSGPSGGAQH